MTLKYEYEHLKDCIEPNELKEYLAAYKKINDNSGFSLTRAENSTTYVKSSSSQNGKGNPYTILYTILALAAIITFAIRRSRRIENF